LQKCKK